MPEFGHPDAIGNDHLLVILIRLRNAMVVGLILFSFLFFASSGRGSIYLSGTQWQKTLWDEEEQGILTQMEERIISNLRER
mmetsp:Transcript_10062/g.20789  ORF Transcript_10062/g.20789 Transcript_10062/m.20789 type:complete len:81 (+) Transcript_10062:108-350(+)|eukprot:CAMPEP_0172461098 /NCGR_PEP_ID=MMETSP1065-20121228/39419_1 /TAXON_ID=265537 /ORGANISM="Amphiprora paludosa, Strain CCMP125" /LENGTH=80 /DNA_ID=CAMNT_0013216315 /DNA_START=65 /DNA_END=307 /DNA_ORIENTATION=+